MVTKHVSFAIRLSEIVEIWASAEVDFLVFFFRRSKSTESYIKEDMVIGYSEFIISNNLSAHSGY